MSKDSKAPADKGTNTKAPQQSNSKPAAAAGSDKCKFEECKKNSAKFGFCAEHYDLYMDGVIRGDGRKPSDYQEKLALHHKKVHKVA